MAKRFSKTKKLTSLTVGENVASIGDSAFNGAIKLKKLDLSKTNVKIIGKNALSGCKALTDLRINGNKIKTIRSWGRFYCLAYIVATNYAMESACTSLDIK